MLVFLSHDVTLIKCIHVRYQMKVLVIRSAAPLNHSLIFMQHWSKLDHHEGEPCPVARDLHAAVCLDYGGNHPQLLVTGGRGAGDKVLSDAWMLDVQSGRWREVRVYAGWMVLFAVQYHLMRCTGVIMCMAACCLSVRG